jgi:hypothetical protein
MRGAPSFSERLLARPALCLVAWALLAGFPLRGQSPPGGGASTNGYMRVASPDTNTVQLEIAIRRLRPVRPGAPVVSLVGVSHLGESNYYAAIQKRLDAQALVLFEGVGHPDARNENKSASDDDAPRPSRKLEVDEESLQFNMAKSLGLAFQLSAIDYDRAHFKNSDMSLEQIARVLGGGASRTTPVETKSAEQPAAKPDAARPSTEFAVLMQVMDGTSFLGRLASGLFKWLGSSPRMQASTKLMLIETLGNLQGDFTEAAALPPDMKRLLAVLLHARNGVVVQDIKTELAKSEPVKTIAVFYGAAHMHDLEKRLCEELGYRVDGDEWLPAISVNLRESGVTTGDLQFIRRTVQWQLQMLNQPRP